VTEGRTAHQRLVSLHEEASDNLDDRKAATRAVRAAVKAVEEELLALVAADEAAALDASRAPAFELSVLRPAT
jgi:hypothetical protein